jgi:hypothetical protein
LSDQRREYKPPSWPWRSHAYRASSSSRSAASLCFRIDARSDSFCFRMAANSASFFCLRWARSLSLAYHRGWDVSWQNEHGSRRCSVPSSPHLYCAAMFSFASPLPLLDRAFACVLCPSVSRLEHNLTYTHVTCPHTTTVNHASSHKAMG